MYTTRACVDVCSCAHNACVLLCVAGTREREREQERTNTPHVALRSIDVVEEAVLQALPGLPRRPRRSPMKTNEAPYALQTPTACEVKASQIADVAGQGLFVAEDIGMNQVITSFRYAVLSPKEWEARCTANGCPLDSGFDFRGRIYYDPTFTNPNNPKQWYKANHSSAPNSAPRSDTSHVYLVSSVGMCKGTEVTFGYALPPGYAFTPVIV